MRLNAWPANNKVNVDYESLKIDPEMILRIDKLLLTRPPKMNSEAKARWDKTKELTTALFEKYKPDNKPLFDQDCDYETWTEGLDKFEGMRHRKTKKAHGLCR